MTTIYNMIASLSTSEIMNLYCGGMYAIFIPLCLYVMINTHNNKVSVRHTYMTCILLFSSWLGLIPLVVYLLVLYISQRRKK